MSSLADYVTIKDGDQTTVKAIFSIEANSQADMVLNSKAHYIGTNGQNVRVIANEAVQALYNLTKVLDKSKLTKPVF